MKHINLTLKKLSLLLFLALGINAAKSQNISDLLRIAPQDIETYTQQYLEPGMVSLGNGLSNGWVNTAKPHKLLGFDITVGVANGLIPADDKLFTFNQNDFGALRYDGTSQLPTFVGGSPAAGSNLYVEANTTVVNPQNPNEQFEINERAEFSPAPGLDTESLPFTAFPAPYIQLGIGLIKGTEVKVRFVPGSVFESISEDITSPTYFGLGVLHDFKQWIPGMKLLPFDLSAFLGWTQFEYTQDFGNQSFEFANNAGRVETSNGSATIASSATTFQVIISKKLSVLTPYASVGFNAINSSINVDGNYTYTYDNTGAEGLPNSLTITDPVDIQFDGTGGPRLTVGARLKLLILTIHADYSLQRYNTFTAGLGLSIR